VSPATTISLSLRPDVVATSEGTEVVLRATRPPAVVRFKQTTAVLQHALHQLGDGAAEDDLMAAALERDGPEGLFKIAHYLKRLHAAALLRWTVQIDGVRFATLEPMARGFERREAPGDRRLQLSTFACARLMESVVGI
jgi:hypothetical protein